MKIDLSLIAMPAKDDGRRLSNEMAACGSKRFCFENTMTDFNNFPHPLITFICRETTREL
jgi:hypothetical protein